MPQSPNPRRASQPSFVVPAATSQSLGKDFAIASHRLDHQKRISKLLDQPFFTSDLSPNEYLLTRESGCQPIGVVMGSSFYHVGFYRNFWGYRGHTGEVTALTQAQLAARELAVSRLQWEAALLGAHGVIGVRLKRSRKFWGFGMVEFTAIGTAIRIPGDATTKEPFTSDLSGQEFWQLRQAGYLPKGLVFGACSYYVHSDRTTRAVLSQTGWNRWFGQARRNQEMVQFTQGFQDARELAIMRLTMDLDRVGAQGSVGMEIDSSHEVITYQPQSLQGCFVQLFLAAAITTMLFTYPALIFGLIPVMMAWSIVNSLTNAGPFRDLLIHFVATGTAIVAADPPITDPVRNTLLFYPLNRS